MGWLCLPTPSYNPSTELMCKYGPQRYIKLGILVRVDQQNLINISTLYQEICNFLDVHERSELQDITLTLHTLPHLSRNLSIDAQGILQVDPEDLIEFPKGIFLVVVSVGNRGGYTTWNAILETPMAPTKR